MIWIEEAVNLVDVDLESKWNKLSEKITAAKAAGASGKATKSMEAAVRQAYVNYGYRYAALQLMLAEMKFGKVVDITQARKALSR